MATFARPENALKRAQELINVGEKQEALEAFHSLITSKRFRGWSKTHEQVMLRYVELCVDMRRGRYAKDGLIQYRGICQHVNITSLEEVVKHFMQLANDRVELAHNEAMAFELEEVDDLDALKTPEDLLLMSYASGGNRSDRELVTPWFNFLWETFRIVLDVLRNNSKLEALYAMTAHRAFQFCKQYKRPTEFRRLCDIMRNHLLNLYKFKEQRDRPDLTIPESMQLCLDTRFEQLKVATDLKLWQEAFRSIEDVYGLMYMLKKTPKPSLMAVYYSKLAEISWVSSDNVSHGYAWLKLFSLQKSFNKNTNPMDLQMIASSAVLAALSALPYNRSYGSSHLGLENENEHNLRMANLISFDVGSKQGHKEMISRSSLLSELAAQGVIKCCTQEVKVLYNILENESCSTDLALRVQPLLETISKIQGKLVSSSSLPEVDMSRYVPSLEKVVVVRLLERISQVYKSMTIDSLSKMIPFFDFPMVEKISVDAVKSRFLAMKVDYRTGAVFFCNKSLESEGFGDQLSSLTESLSKSLAMICPPENKRQKLGGTVSSLAAVVEKEHRYLLARKSIVEKRKEEQEHRLLEMEREEEAKRLKLQKKTEEEEQRRLAIEFELMKNQRIQREIEERELEEARALLQEAEKLSKKKGKKPLLEGEKISKQTLMELAVSEQLREKQEMEKRLRKLGRTMDYLERAKREEAAPLIAAAYQKRLEEERVCHELMQQQEVDFSKQCHAGNLEEKRRLGRMMVSEFLEGVLSRRKAEHERVRKEREVAMSNILRSRKAEREDKRKIIYFLKCEEERQTRLREEEAACKLQEMERQKKKEADRKAKLDEIASKQRQREREVEEKQRQMREELLGRMKSAVPQKTTSHLSATATATATSTAKFVPSFRRPNAENFREWSNDRKQSSSTSASKDPQPQPQHEKKRIPLAFTTNNRIHQV